MNKHSSLGFLLGILTGILLYLIFPDLLNLDLDFNRSFRSKQGYPDNYYSAKSGSIFSTGLLLPAIFGLIGWLVGFTYSKKLNPK